MTLRWSTRLSPTLLSPTPLSPTPLSSSRASSSLGIASVATAAGSRVGGDRARRTGRSRPYRGRVRATTRLIILVAGLIAIGCYERGAPESPPIADRAPNATTESEPDDAVSDASFHIEHGNGAFGFEGLAGAIGGDGSIDLYWSPPNYDVREYRVYTATRPGQQDFRSPLAVVAPDASSDSRFHRFQIEPLAHGTTLFCVVRAVGRDGVEEFNEVEWGASSNPVFQVTLESAEDGAQTDEAVEPAASDSGLEEAMARAISLDGVNIYVERGTLRERLFVFDGMMIYGGFGPSFDPWERMISGERTRVVARSEQDAVVVAPGDLLCGVDGFELDGRGRARRGVVAEDCLLQVAHTRIHGFEDKGVELRSGDDAGDELEGALLECEIHGNAAEGVALSGIFDLALRSCVVRENEEEGIEIEPLAFSTEEKSTLVLDRCRIEGNRDLGLNVTIARHVEDPEVRGGRVRIELANSSFERNRDHGASLDVQADAADALDLRIEVSRCRFAGNGKAGLEIDADVRGSYSIERSRFSHNGSAGLLLSGDAPLALIRVRESTFGGPSASVSASSPVTAWLDRCRFGREASVERGPGHVVVVDPAIEPSLDTVEASTASPVARSEDRSKQDVEWVDPPLTHPIGRPRWHIEFRNALRPDDVTITLSRDDRVVPHRSAIDGESLRIEPDPMTPPSDAASEELPQRWTVEVAPAHDSLPAERHFPRYRFEYRADRAPTEPLGSPGHRRLQLVAAEDQEIALRSADEVRQVRLQWAQGIPGHLQVAGWGEDRTIEIDQAGWTELDLPADTEAIRFRLEVRDPGASPLTLDVTMPEE